jgi:hypothetical protein
MCAKEILINDTDVLGCLDDLNTTLVNVQNNVSTLNVTITNIENELIMLNGSIPIGNATACCDALNTTIITIEEDITNIENDISLFNTSINENTQCCQELNDTLNNNLTLTDDPAGETLINDGTGPDFVIKRLLAGDNIVITSNPTNLELNVTLPTLIHSVYTFSAGIFAANDFIQTMGSTATEFDAQYMITSAGVLRDLYIQTSPAIPGGQSCSCFVNVNGLATAISAAASGGSTGSDTVSTAAVSAGDLVSIFCALTGGAGTPSVTMGISLADS